MFHLIWAILFIIILSFDVSKIAKRPFHCSSLYTFFLVSVHTLSRKMTPFRQSDNTTVL